MSPGSEPGLVDDFDKTDKISFVSEERVDLACLSFQWVFLELSS